MAPAPDVSVRTDKRDPTYRYNWRIFQTWCLDNQVDVKSGIPAVEKYVASLLQRDLSPVTARIYVGGICRGAAEAGILIDKDDPRIEALFVPFVEGHQQRRVPIQRGSLSVASGADKPTLLSARPSFASLIASIMNMKNTPMASRLRERAFLLAGFSAGLSVDELISAKIEHVRVSPGNGVLLYVHRPSKKLHPVAVFYWPYGPSPLMSPATALLEWLHHHRTGRVSAGSDGALLFSDAENGEAMSPAVGLAIVNRARVALDLGRRDLHNSALPLDTDMIAVGGAPLKGIKPEFSRSALAPLQKIFTANERLWKLEWYDGDDGDGSITET